MKSSLTLLFLLGAVLFGQAQIATVQGSSLQYPDRAFKVYEQINYLTGQQKLLVEGRIDEYGAFSFELPVSVTTGLTMRVEGVTANLFVQPDKTYVVTLLGIQANKVRRLTDNQVAFEFEEATSEGNVNVVLASIDRQVQNFSRAQAVDLTYRDAANAVTFKGRTPQRGKLAPQPIEKPDTMLNVSRDLLNNIDAFKRKMVGLFAKNTDDPFVKSYVELCIAGLELQAGKKRWDVYYEYLHEKEVLRRNPEYARFANQFYGGLFLDSFSRSDYRYSKAVNSIKDAKGIITALQSDLYMDDPNLAHVAMLINLQEVYFRKGWGRGAIESILESAAQSPDFKDFNQDFQYLADNIGSGLKGSRLPDFKMLDQNGELVNWSDFEKKYVYVGFFTSWSRDSYNEMQLLGKFKIKYGSDVKFVSINLDSQYENFTDFVTTNNSFDWTILYGPSNDDVYDMFSIHAVPTYVLIDPNGNIMYDYTRKPSEGINLEFDKIKAQKNKPGKLKVWDD